MPDRTACPNCHERYVNVVGHLKRNARCHRAVLEGRVIVRDAVLAFIEKGEYK